MSLFVPNNTAKKTAENLYEMCKIRDEISKKISAKEKVVKKLSDDLAEIKTAVFSSTTAGGSMLIPLRAKIRIVEKRLDRYLAELAQSYIIRDNADSQIRFAKVMYTTLYGPVENVLSWLATGKTLIVAIDDVD